MSNENLAYSYTGQDAVDDGSFIDITDIAARMGFITIVRISKRVYDLIDNVKDDKNDIINGISEDIGKRIEIKTEEAYNLSPETFGEKTVEEIIQEVRLCYLKGALITEVMRSLFDTLKKKSRENPDDIFELEKVNLLVNNKKYEVWAMPDDTAGKAIHIFLKEEY